MSKVAWQAVVAGGSGVWVALFFCLCVAAGAPGVARAAETPAEDGGATRALKITVEPRHALVIGNSNYKEQRLANPVNDAQDMAKTLRGLGFEVMETLDGSLEQMDKAISEFGKAVKKGGVGLFYYAGHGVQVGGHNYLIPVDARIESEGDFKYKAVDAGLVMSKMEDAEAGVNIVILDACRNNPFARAFKRSTGSRGLAQMDAPSGTLIAYATSPGAEAADGDGRNGVFTKYLLKELTIPNQTIGQVLMRVRAQVSSETGKKQAPWESSSLTGEFFPAGRIEASLSPQSPDLDAERRRIGEMQAKLEADTRRVEEKQKKLDAASAASREPVSIGQLEVGQKAWIEPKAMYADKNRKAWLRRDYKTSPWQLGEMKMQIERTPAGFRADIAGISYKWETLDAADKNDVPVSDLNLKKTVQTVADMQVGPKAWVTAAGVYADKERKLWLKREATIAPQTTSEATIQIERTDTGFIVDIKKSATRKFATETKTRENDVAVAKLVY